MLAKTRQNPVRDKWLEDSDALKHKTKTEDKNFQNLCNAFKKLNLRKQTKIRR